MYITVAEDIRIMNITIFNEILTLLGIKLQKNKLKPVFVQFCVMLYFFYKIIM